MMTMDETDSRITHQLAQFAGALQARTTGHAPQAATVVLSQDTLVVTLHDALSPAEKILSQSPAGAAQVQEFHRQLFSNSSAPMWEEIKRITGREVREAGQEFETATGAVVHPFVSGTLVQVFLLRAGDDREDSGRAT